MCVFLFLREWSLWGMKSSGSGPVPKFVSVRPNVLEPLPLAGSVHTHVFLMQSNVKNSCSSFYFESIGVGELRKNVLVLSLTHASHE